jgi:allophanate hydrolase subunit 2
VRYQIPEDRAFVLYPNERFEGAGAIVLRGDGRVHEIDLGSVAQLRPVRSCRFQPLSVAELLTGSTVV